MMADDWKPNGFDVMKRVGDKNNGDDIQLAALGSNLIRAQYGKRGTQVIGVAGNVVAGLMGGEFLGGLILVRKSAWREAEDELKAEHEATS